MNYAKAVQKGIELLDSQYDYWREDIDITTLDLSNPSNCILGQLFRTYSKGLQAIGCWNAPKYGFITVYFEDWQELTDEWKTQLASN